MGLILSLPRGPSPLDSADNGLATPVYVDVLDGDESEWARHNELIAWFTRVLLKLSLIHI